MKKVRYLGILLAISLISGLILAPFAVYAYDGVTPIVWNPTVPNYNASAVIHNGTIDTSSLTFGDFLGIAAGQPNATGFGDSGVSVNWDDTWVGGVGNPNTNGDALDGLWAQIILPNEGWWDLGNTFDRVVVFLAQDHGPYPGEGLEYRLYGSNTLWGNVGSQAVLLDVYLDGWRPHNPAEDANQNGWCSDDIAAVFQLDGAYRYVKLAAWSPDGGLNEPEVDALAGVRRVVDIDIDIKPGSFPNSINPDTNGVIPVAILTTDAFDATTVDASTVTFGPAEATMIHKNAHLEDVDGDGDTDMVLHFRTQDTGIAHGDTEATHDGVLIIGVDSVRTVPEM
jgi:hypothetical protein